MIKNNVKSGKPQFGSIDLRKDEEKIFFGSLEKTKRFFRWEPKVNLKKGISKTIKYYEKIKQQNPQNANYHYKYGGALGMKAKESNKFAALGMIDDVEDAFLIATKLDKKHIESRWALVIFILKFLQ